MKVEDINLRPALIDQIEDKLDKVIFNDFKREVYESIDLQKADIGTEVLETESKTLKGAINEVNTKVSTKTDKNNYVANNGYAVTTGTSTVYTTSLSPAPTAYIDGINITIKPHVDCGANPTVNVNGLGSTSLCDNEGNPLSAGDLKTNIPYRFVRVGNSFFQSSGGNKIAKVTRSTTDFQSYDFGVYYVDFKKKTYAIQKGDFFYKYDFKGNGLFSKNIQNGNLLIIGATNEEYLVADAKIGILYIYDYNNNVKLQFNANDVISNVTGYLNTVRGCIYKDKLVCFRVNTQNIYTYDRIGNLISNSYAGYDSSYYDNWMIGGKETNPIILSAYIDRAVSIYMTKIKEDGTRDGVDSFTSKSASQLALQLITYMMGGR